MIYNEQQLCDFKPGHHSDFPPPLRTQSRARLIVWRFRHMDSRARLCVRSGGGKSLWCPGSKSHHWWAV